MIKKLRVTVDGVSYDVVVELPEDTGVAAPPATAPVPPLISSITASNPPPPSAPSAPAPAPASVPSAGPGDVPSPLSGRVTAVVVTAGQEVKEGDHLLTLEAMKMNTFVFAPKTGKVADLRAAVGDVVEENQILMRIQ
jgi:biotin carboxyl carrier protein